MSRVLLTASALLLVACSGNGTGGTGDSGTGNVIPCDGGSITLDVTAPDCLWAPDHKMVLFTLDDIHATVTGSCGAPTLSIVSVTSNQPALGGGQGAASPDYSFNSSGVCLRSEREGTSSDPRVYTITVAASDGNVTVQQSVEVTVAHDQSDPKCPAVDSSRVVDDGDPRCN
ncbi:MAG TPA: hypothetical protein VGH28_06245 [Polyangiaceae bacterium]|jgi:hypothetical protein